MRKKPLAALLLAILLVLLVAPASLAANNLMAKGKVKGNFYSNDDGLSFTVPEDFELVAQQTNKLDFLRIILEGPQEHSFSPCIVIDVSTGYQDITTYSGSAYMSDILSNPLYVYDNYKDGYLFYLKLLEEYGATIMETLMSFRLDRDGVPRVAFCYGYTWSTDRYFVRAYYICFGAQRTLTSDVARFKELYNSMVTP
jgi:hypothetical protein